MVTSLLARAGLRIFLREMASLCAAGPVSQRMPRDLISKVLSFVLRVRKLRQEHEYPLYVVGIMDETLLWLDMPGDHTVARVGERSVSVRATGHDKSRFTVILAAMADG